MVRGTDVISTGPTAAQATLVERVDVVAEADGVAVVAALGGVLSS
jgi:hypothetical protein